MSPQRQGEQQIDVRYNPRMGQVPLQPFPKSFQEKAG
jgi:hypothetical protein